MISKKSRKIIAAVLIGATICASGTFAYFNSVLDLNQGLSNDSLNKSLKITNGHVEITGKIGGEELADVDHLWYYDVASKSAVEDLQKYAKDKIYTTVPDGTIANQSAATNTQDSLLASLKAKLAALGFDYVATKDTKMSDLTAENLVNANFVASHVSPDFAIDGTSVANTVSDTKCIYNGKIYDLNAVVGTSKKADLVKAINDEFGNTLVTDSDTLAEIKQKAAEKGITVSDYSVVKQGTEINPGSISLTRPGDAIGLGKLNEDGTIDGLEIVNKSNITTKLDIRLKTDSTGAIDKNIIESIKGLADAGWVLYVNDARFDFSKYLNGGSIEDAAKDLQTELINNSAVYAKGNSTIKLNVKLELPLMTGNYYQDKDTTNAGKQVNFDVTQLFDIVATQENNPGVNEDGTNDPLKSNIKSNNGGSEATDVKDNGQLREGTLD